MKLNGKYLIIASLLFSATSVSVSAQADQASVQSLPVVSLGALQAQQNLNQNLRSERPPINSRTRTEDLHISYFRGIDLSDRPLKKKDIYKVQTSKTEQKTTTNTKSTDSED